MTLEEELQLVEAAKIDVRAFEKLYDYYVDRIFNYCFHRVLHKEMAEDVTSTVFLKAVQQIKKYDTSKGVRFGSWLYRAAHNQIIDNYRKKGNDMLEFKENLVASDENPETSLQLATKQKQIAMTLGTLNPRYQQVISLKFFDGLDNSEIAEIMDEKVSNIAVILHRSLKKFKKLYEKNFGKSEIF